MAISLWSQSSEYLIRFAPFLLPCDYCFKNLIWQSNQIATGGGVLLPKFAHAMKAKKTAILSMFLLGLGTLISIALENQLIFWLATMVTTIGAAIAFSFIITLFSQVVSKVKQAW